MYSKIFQHFINPFFENVLKRRKMLAYRKFLEDSQWWPRERLLDFQWQELKKLLAHVYEQVPYWKKTFSRLGIRPDQIDSYQDFLKLPIITKDEIRAHHDGMIADNYRGKTWQKATGGSTGAPLQLDYTPESFDWRVAISKRGYKWAHCEDGMRQAWIWGVDIGEKTALKKFKEKLHKRLWGQIIFNCFQFNEKKMEECLKKLNRFQPEIIVGYTNPLYNFTRFVEKTGKFNFRPMAVISAAEKLHEYQRREIAKVFRCGVFNTYGSREFMLIAAECSEHKGLHLSVENLFIEIIRDDGLPAEPGEAGDIVITDLHNYGMPFLRYKIGDMAIASDRVCACGRGLPLVEDVIGRSLDMIRTPDGKSIPGEFFPHLMKEFRGIKQFQVVQNALDQLVVKIVKTPDFTDADLEFMKREILKVTGEEVKVKFQFVSEIPLTKTGKYRVTVSEIGG